MKKYGLAVLLAFALNILPAKPQTALPPYEFSVPASTTLENCVVVPNYTTWCWTGDGHRYVSVNGAAFVLDNTAVGVTSITVNGGTPQTGPVVLTIPSKVTITSSAVVTSNGTLQ